MQTSGKARRAVRKVTVFQDICEQLFSDDVSPLASYFVMSTAGLPLATYYAHIFSHHARYIGNSNF
jgi:hypothetical protein